MESLSLSEIAIEVFNLAIKKYKCVHGVAIRDNQIFLYSTEPIDFGEYKGYTIGTEIQERTVIE